MTSARGSFPVIRGACLAALAFLGSCGDDDASARVPSRVRLVDCEGELAAPRAGPASVVLSEDFSRVEGWSVITSREKPLEVDAGALVVEPAGTKSDAPYLRLSGRQGGLYRVLSIEPDTPYEFAGSLRALDVVPVREPFHGATFWLGELDTAGDPQSLFQGGGWFRHRHEIEFERASEEHDGGSGGTADASDRGSDAGSDWRHALVAFRSGADSRSLIVGAILAVSEQVKSGEVHFGPLELRRIDPIEYWEWLAAKAVSAAHRGDAPPRGWRARRSVGAMLGGERRPAILVLPGERLTLRVPVPRGAAVLDTGLAPWPEDHRPRSDQTLAFHVRVDGREILGEHLALAAPLSELGWRDARADLAPWAGRTVELELSVDGPLPGLFGGAVAWSPEPRAAEAGAGGFNVLLVSIDTLRADHVGAYGCERRTTPHLDELAARSVVFEQAYAQAPYTLPSHATLFSGQLPLVHGVEGAGQALSALRSPLLAKTLAAQGYRTAAFTAGGFLVPDFGFHAGFDEFSIIDPLRHSSSGFFAALSRSLPDQVSASAPREPGRSVREWLARHAAEPFFLFVHTYEVHEYDPPDGYTTCAETGCAAPDVDYHDYLMTPKRNAPVAITDEVRAHIGHLYDAALRHVDEELGKIFDELERQGVAERTIVLVTSDHGEEHFERGFLQHGRSLYEEMLRVPLILYVPGVAPRRETAPVQLADVAPTILGALGLEPDPRMQGLDLLRSRLAPRSIWTEVDDSFARKRSLRDADGWKLIHGPTDAPVAFPSAREWELYDLGADPLERVERSAENPERLKALQAELERYDRRLRELREALGEIESGAALDEATRLQLEHLGYSGTER